MQKALSILFAVFVYLPVNIYAQTITTFAGGGVTLGDGGPAVSASLSQVSSGRGLYCCSLL